MSWSIFKTNFQPNAWYFSKNQHKLTVDEITTSSLVTFNRRQQVHEEKKITSHWPHSKSVHCQSQSCFHTVVRRSHRDYSPVSVIPHTNWRDFFCFQSLFRAYEQNFHVELFKVYNAHILQKYLYLWDFKYDGYSWPSKRVWEDLQRKQDKRT